MKRLTTKLFAGSFVAALLIAGCGSDTMAKKAAPQADASFATKVAVDSKAITGKKVTESLADITANSGLWSDATFSKVTLYPQTTISFNDKEALRLNKDNGAKTAKVAALYNDKEVALAIIWPDKSENVHNGKCLDTYADGVAFQFANGAKDATKLPYIGMGSQGREVAIYLQKIQFNNYEPNGKGDLDSQVSRNQTNFYNDASLYQDNATDKANKADLAAFDKKVAALGSDDFERKFVSAGFRSMTEIKDGSDKSKLTISRIKGYGWIATLVRPLKDEYADLSQSVPVAFAIWDGAKDNRNGLKLLSGWNAVTLAKEDKKLIEVVNDMVATGDIKNGQEQAIINCGACHAFPGAMPATKYMAPNLSNIGGYSTAAYIKESMLKPHAVVVPGYNRNAHKNDMWYTMNGKKRESTMPAFDYLDAKTLNDITAYFKTLKAKGE